MKKYTWKTTPFTTDTPIINYLFIGFGVAMLLANVLLQFHPNTAGSANAWRSMFGYQMAGTVIFLGLFNQWINTRFKDIYAHSITGLKMVYLTGVTAFAVVLLFQIWAWVTLNVAAPLPAPWSYILATGVLVGAGLLLSSDLKVFKADGTLFRLVDFMTLREHGGEQWSKLLTTGPVPVFKPNYQAYLTAISTPVLVVDADGNEGVSTPDTAPHEEAFMRPAIHAFLLAVKANQIEMTTDPVCINPWSMEMNSLAWEAIEFGYIGSDGKITERGERAIEVAKELIQGNATIMVECVHALNKEIDRTEEWHRFLSNLPTRQPTENN